MCSPRYSVHFLVCLVELDQKLLKINHLYQSLCTQLGAAMSRASASEEDTSSDACNVFGSCSGASSFFISPPFSLDRRAEKYCAIANAASLWPHILKHLSALQAKSHYYMLDSFSALSSKDKHCYTNSAYLTLHF